MPWYVRPDSLDTTPPDSEDAVPTPAEAVDPSNQYASHSSPSSSRLGGLVQVARPRQWIKNLLVFVAPAVAGVLFHQHALLRSVAAFGMFCIAASGAYFLNDSLDAEADRAHPVKRLRPIAAGVVPVGAGLGIGIGLLIVSVALGSLLAGWHMAVVMVTYGVINTVYSLGLKNEPILDLAAVSSGEVRRIAGTSLRLEDLRSEVSQCFEVLLVLQRVGTALLDEGVEQLRHLVVVLRVDRLFVRYQLAGVVLNRLGDGFGAVFDAGRKLADRRVQAVLADQLDQALVVERRDHFRLVRSDICVEEVAHIGLVGPE